MAVMRRALLTLLAVFALGACRGEIGPGQSPLAVHAQRRPVRGPAAAVERAASLAVEEPAAWPCWRPRAAATRRSRRADHRSVADPGGLSAEEHARLASCAIDAARVYAHAGIPMITPSATAPALTLQQESGGWSGDRVVFRLPPSDAVQGDALGEHAVRRLGVRTFAVLHDRTPYGLGIAEAFRAAVEKRGATVTLFDAVERGGKDFDAALAAVDESRAGALFYGGVYPEAAPLLKRARARGFTGAFLAGDGVKSGDFVAGAGAAAEGAVLSVAGVPIEDLPSAADFVARYTARYGEPPRTFDHYGYEAARIALGAARKAGRDRKAALDWIRTTRHDSMVGPFIFDAKGDSLKSLVTVLKVERGRFTHAY